MALTGDLAKTSSSSSSQWDDAISVAALLQGEPYEGVQSA
jgi:hypothetical protein